MTDTRKEDFMADLQALLDKHNAELQAFSIYVGSGYVPTCVVSFTSDPYRTHLEFELPTYLSPNT